MCNNVCLSCGCFNAVKLEFTSSPEFVNANLLSSGNYKIFKCDSCDAYSLIYSARYRDLLSYLDSGKILRSVNPRVTIIMDQGWTNDLPTQEKLKQLFKDGVIEVEHQEPDLSNVVFVSVEELIN
jgi:hypothetical protein